MKAKQKRCPYCGRLFHPDRRARVQKCCGQPGCQRARKRQNLRHWRSLHPGHADRYQAKERAWAKAYPDYWRDYRKRHPEYVARESQRRATAQKRARRSANETGMKQAVVENLRILDALEKPTCSANETGFLRRVGAMEACLRSTVAVVCSAK